MKAPRKSDAEKSLMFCNVAQKDAHFLNGHKSVQIQSEEQEINKENKYINNQRKESERI